MTEDHTLQSAPNTDIAPEDYNSYETAPDNAQAPSSDADVLNQPSTEPSTDAQPAPQDTTELPDTDAQPAPQDTTAQPDTDAQSAPQDTTDQPDTEQPDTDAPQTSPKATELAELHPALNKYTDLQTIGIGGQGTMLRAIAPDGQPVAIKVFDIQTTDSFKSIELFEREIDTLKNINIHGVPKFIEDIRSEKYIYLVEEYIDAPSLEKIMKAGKRYSFNQIVTILKNAARILNELTSLVPPVIHRDIKPANLLVDDDLNVTLVDFGAVAAKVQLSFAMTFAGTAGYLAPEQLYGKATPASDIFSLGVTIAHLITNKEPCDMEMDDMRLKIEKYIPPTIPFWFIGFLLLMIEPNTSTRFQNGQQVLDYLDRIDNYTQDELSNIDLLINRSNAPIASTETTYDPDLPSDPNNLLAYQSMLGKTYRNFKAHMKDYRFWGLYFPLACILLLLPIFILGATNLSIPLSTITTTCIPAVLPPLLIFISIIVDHAPSPLQFRNQKITNTKLAKHLNDLYKRELIKRTLAPNDALYKEKHFIELSKKLNSPENFRDEDIAPLTEEENKRLDLYLNDTKVLYPCLRYKPIRNFKTSTLIKTIIHPALLYIASLLVILFSTLPNWWNFILLISLTIFAFRIVQGLTQCTLYHRTRYNDPRHLDAYKLYTRRFLEECRTQARTPK